MNTDGRRQTRTMGVTAAIIAAVAALLSELGKLGDAVHAPCATMSALPWCSAPPPRPLPKLAGYTSPWVDGGHTQAEFCGPPQQAYQSQYPDFVIAWTASEGRDKDWKRHVTYQYHCEYAATPKAPGK